MRFATPRAGLEFEVGTGAAVIFCVLAALSGIHLDLYGGVVSAVFLVFSLLFHELAHLGAAVGFGVPVKTIGFSSKGAYLRRRDSRDPIIEGMVAVCGPIASLLLFTLFRHSGPILEWVAQLNLVLALTNLVPIKGTDGDRILNSLAQLMPIRTSN